MGFFSNLFNKKGLDDVTQDLSSELIKDEPVNPPKNNKINNNPFSKMAIASYASTLIYTILEMLPLQVQAQTQAQDIPEGINDKVCIVKPLIFSKNNYQICEDGSVDISKIFKLKHEDYKGVKFEIKPIKYENFSLNGLTLKNEGAGFFEGRLVSYVDGIAHDSGKFRVQTLDCDKNSLNNKDPIIVRDTVYIDRFVDSSDNSDNAGINFKGTNIKKVEISNNQVDVTGYDPCCDEAINKSQEKRGFDKKKINLDNMVVGLFTSKQQRVLQAGLSVDKRLFNYNDNISQEAGIMGHYTISPFKLEKFEKSNKDNTIREDMHKVQQWVNAIYATLPAKIQPNNNFSLSVFPYFGIKENKIDSTYTFSHSFNGQNISEQSFDLGTSSTRSLTGGLGASLNVTLHNGNNYRIQLFGEAGVDFYNRVIDSNLGRENAHLPGYNSNSDHRFKNPIDVSGQQPWYIKAGIKIPITTGKTNSIPNGTQNNNTYNNNRVYNRR